MLGCAGRSGRIFADDESGRAVRVYVVGAVLGVIFENKNGGVIPIRTIGDGFHDAAQRQVVIGNGGRRTRKIGTRTSRMVVRQVEQNKCRHLEFKPFMRIAGANESGEFVHEFVGAKLIGIVRIEIGIQRIEMVAQNCLSWLHSTEQRHRPRPRAGSSVRISNVRRQHFTLLHNRLWTA